MHINYGASIIQWNKGHYGNVFLDGVEIDCFSFAWEKNRPTALDFTTAVVSYLEGF
jgi:hypothetical protein